jgi:hypothetical protein
LIRSSFLFPKYLTNDTIGGYNNRMLSLRRVQELQDRRSLVHLTDGRVGKIVRVDTIFPDNKTVVSIYTNGAQGLGIAKVSLEQLLSSAPEGSAPEGGAPEGGAPEGGAPESSAESA